MKGGRIFKMTGAGSISRELVALFEPQVEQLGIRLERRSGIWTGFAAGGKAQGSMWLCTPSPHCLVLCHDVIPLEDMPLFEGSLGPYACACTMGVDAVECSRDCGLPVRFVGTESCRQRPGDEVATFVEQGPRSLSSRLVAGRVYRSRSIIMLPDLFDELERRYSGEFSKLFPAFGKRWGTSSELAIRDALDAIPTHPPTHPGSELGLLSTVTSLLASLVADGTGACQDTEDLARRAERLIASAIEVNGVPPSVDDLTNALYISRSRLCDAFKRSTGHSIGAYARKLRMARACRLLEGGGLSIAEVAATLGYPSPSAFCHAFASAMGLSPRKWVELQQRR